MVSRDMIMTRERRHGQRQSGWQRDVVREMVNGEHAKEKIELELRFHEESSDGVHSHRQLIASCRMRIWLGQPIYIIETIIPWLVNTTTIFSTQNDFHHKVGMFPSQALHSWMVVP